MHLLTSKSFLFVGLMFVGRQHFPGSRGRNFVDSENGINLIKIKRIIVYRFVGMYIRGQG